jgi:hypothetical protein
MMRRPAVPFRPILILSAFALLALPLAAAAQEDDGSRDASFEVFGGPSAEYSSLSGVTLHNRSFGLRGGLRVSRVWSLEAEDARSTGRPIAYDGEVSAKAYLFQTDRFRLFALAGPGIHEEDRFGDTRYTATVHAGLGGEIALAPRIYLRPEVRGRWPADHFSGRNHTLDYTVGLGLRF